MKKLKQGQLAKELGISKSYLSMILSGQRKATPELVDKLQSIPGVHKIVNDSLWNMLHTQEVSGSSPLPPTTVDDIKNPCRLLERAFRRQGHRVFEEHFLPGYLYLFHKEEYNQFVTQYTPERLWVLYYIMERDKREKVLFACNFLQYAEGLTLVTVMVIRG